MRQAPFFKLYTEEYQLATRLLTTEEKGLYMDLTVLLWQAGGKIMFDFERLPKLLGVNKLKFRKLMAGNLGACFYDFDTYREAIEQGLDLDYIQGNPIGNLGGNPTSNPIGNLGGIVEGNPITNPICFAAWQELANSPKGKYITAKNGKKATGKKAENSRAEEEKNKNNKNKKEEEAEEEIDKDAVNHSAASASFSSLIPYEEIAEAYNIEIGKYMNNQAIITNLTKQLIAQTWNSDKERQNLEFWIMLFNEIYCSDFLTEKMTPPLTFVWAIKPDNIEKVLTGMYDNNYKPKFPTEKTAYDYAKSLIRYKAQIDGKDLKEEEEYGRISRETDAYCVKINEELKEKYNNNPELRSQSLGDYIKEYIKTECNKAREQFRVKRLAEQKAKILANVARTKEQNGNA